MADAVFMAESKVKKLVRALTASKHVVVKGLLHRGLSLDESVIIPGEQLYLRCKNCSSRLTSLPCAWCQIETQRADLVKPDKVIKGRRPKRPKRTVFLPGTAEKIAVMRKRHSEGFAVFSIRDK